MNELGATPPLEQEQFCLLMGPQGENVKLGMKVNSETGKNQAKS